MKTAGITRWLAVVALILGTVAVFGDPYGGSVVELDTQELALIVQRKQDHVTVEELAHDILQGRTDLRLLDLREEVAYAEYHIPGAELVALGELVDYPLERNERVLVYSDGGIHAAQGWMLLKALGYPAVYTLLGGLDAWKEEILFPELPASDDPSTRAANDRRRFVSEFFGGAPLTDIATDLERPLPSLPKVDGSAAPPVRRKKKRKEGC